MEIAEGKEWTKDLDQKQFVPEFMKRHPKSDWIPNVEKWKYVPYSDKPKKPPVPDMPKVKPPVTEEPKKEQILICKGCKKEFKGKPRFAHLATHKKKCKDYLNLRRE